MPSSINKQAENPKLLNSNADEDIVDIGQIAASVIAHWYIFFLGILLCVSLAIVYAYYSPPDWRSSAKILVEDSKNSPSSAASASGLGADFSSVFNVKSSADNEVQILKSRSLMENTVKRLQLNVRTYKVGRFGKSTEIYDQAPFEVKISGLADSIQTRKYNIEFHNGEKFSLTNAKDSVNITARLGSQIKLSKYYITLLQLPGRKLNGTYEINIESTDAAVDALGQSFTAALSDKQSTTIDLTLTYPQPKKAEVILNELMDLYLLSNLDNKVKTADNTINFIDQRIDLVAKDLYQVENELEKYRKDNNIADLGAQSKALVTSVEEYQDRLNQEETQLSVVNDIEKILNNPDDDTQIPGSDVLPSDVSFGAAITAYNQLLLQKDRLKLGYTNDNPVVQNVDTQIKTSRATLLNAIASYKRSLQSAKAELKKQNNMVNGKVQEIPAKDRGFLDFQRTQTLKQDLYLYLLQKREETAISKTSTISSSRIIDPAKSDSLPYKPKKSIIYLIGLVMGLVLPAFYLFVKELLNVKVTSKQDITKITAIPIVGEVGHNETKETLVVINNSRTVVSEQFRNIRTKLNYLLHANKPNVLLFTSSMGGEGKSFLSLNLGSALALTGKKVVFMELDLRKPKLSELMGHDHNVYGYSNYVVSEFNDFDKLVKPIWFHENCSLISSGPIPPNPAELLASEKLPYLIEELRRKFDYVIIDCAPIGLVTDALLIEKYVDLTFYVVRENFTYKTQLDIANDLKKNSEVKNMYLILNDIKTKKSGYSTYGYSLEEARSWKDRFKDQVKGRKKGQ